MERLRTQDPRWIGDYRLLRRLGEGGMGRVYLARSRRGRTVAVKVVQQELARQADFRRRFTQEISAAQRVGGEWTAPVLGADPEADTPWVATGYIAGPSLTEVVEEQYGPLPERSVVALASGLTRALQAIHGSGLVHRDLKPSNVLVTIDGPRVIDFGIARALDSTVQSAGGLTHTGALVGSPGFMSPEQVRGLQVTPAGDVFCLGAVLAYAATGRLPFGTPESGIHALLFRIAEEEPDLTGIDGALHELIAACLQKEPAQRPAVEELRESTGVDVRGVWLPGEVLAQLGRHAAALLDSEDPEGDAESRGPDHAGASAPEAGADTVADTDTGAGAGAVTDAGAVTGAGAGAAPGADAASGAASGSGPGKATQPPGAYGPPTGVYGPPAPAPGYGQPWQHLPPPPTGFTGFGPGPPPVGTPPPGPNGPAAPGMGTPPPGARPAALRAAQRARGLGNALCALLGVFLLWSVIHLVVDVTVLNGVSDARSHSGSGMASLIDGYSGHKIASEALEGTGLLLSLPLITLWLVWFWRVRANAEAFAPGLNRYPSGMAIGCWFIPVCFWFFPKQILNDVWRAGERDGTLPNGAWNAAAAGRVAVPHRALTNAWWTLWVVYFTVCLFGGWESWYNQPLDEAATVAATNVFLSLVGLPLGVVALLMVVRLSDRQDARSSAV